MLPVDKIRMKPRLCANIAGILYPKSIPQQFFSVVQLFSVEQFFSGIVNRIISAISELCLAWFRPNFAPSNELTFSSIDTLYVGPQVGMVARRLFFFTVITGESKPVQYVMIRITLHSCVLYYIIYF